MTPLSLRQCRGCEHWSSHRVTDPDTKALHADCTKHDKLKRGSDKCSDWQKRQPKPGLFRI